MPSGLRRIELADKPAFDQFFSTCQSPLSDYSFANTFIWRDSIHLRWAVLHDCLCVFANGDGGLTMLFPPLGRGDLTAATREALGICEDYNNAARLNHWTRIEYVSKELLAGIKLPIDVAPMSGDYVYLTQRMIDLAGGDLASKRQASNRFARRYQARTEELAPHHVPQCLGLLELWQRQAQHQDQAGSAASAASFKRGKEIAATADALRHADALGLRGMVLIADDRIVGFTLGEMISPDTCSIVIEKTDRQYVGSAQYIFSEFCRRYWSHARWCNVGDDWEIPSLAWTKQSYRPAMRIEKYVVRPARAVKVLLQERPCDPLVIQTRPAEQTLQLGARCGTGILPVNPLGREAPTISELPVIQSGCVDDLDGMLELEHKCFSNDVAMNRRQMRYLLSSPHVSSHVLRQDGRIVAAALVLHRKAGGTTTARLYSIAVDQDCRGKGLGRMLLDDCLQTLRRRQAAAVTLEVAVENAPAISLYESSGFVRTRRMGDYYAPGKDAWKMRLDLTNQQKDEYSTPARAGSTSNAVVRTH